MLKRGLHLCSLADHGLHFHFVFLLRQLFGHRTDLDHQLSAPDYTTLIFLASAFSEKSPWFFAATQYTWRKLSFPGRKFGAALRHLFTSPRAMHYAEQVQHLVVHASQLFHPSFARIMEQFLDIVEKNFVKLRHLEIHGRSPIVEKLLLVAGRISRDPLAPQGPPRQELLLRGCGVASSIVSGFLRSPKWGDLTRVDLGLEAIQGKRE